MRILITGSTGFLGTPLCHRLARGRHDVCAMSRRTRNEAHFDHDSISLVPGDITAFESLHTAIDRCDVCFHLAALVKPFSSQATDFQKINVEGTRNVFEAALKANLKRVVFTSTASVFGPSTIDHPTTELSPIRKTADTLYEQSKIECESVVREFQAKGLDVVTVYPSRVFGPGSLNASNSLTQIIKQFKEGKWRTIPADGKSVGNYVFIDDIVDGHSRAMFQSAPNEHYLLGGENLSFNQIAAHLQAITGSDQRLYHVPRKIIEAYGLLQIGLAKLFNQRPKITREFVKKYLNDWYLDCSKAQRELGWEATPFVEAVRKTVSWLDEPSK